MRKAVCWPTESTWDKEGATVEEVPELPTVTKSVLHCPDVEQIPTLAVPAVIPESATLVPEIVAVTTLGLLLLEM